VFWDEQAIALSEVFSLGECIEVIGRSGRSAKEIQPLNMRKSTVMIECSREPGSIKPPERRSVDLVVLVCNPVHEYTKRDGTPGSMISGLAGTADGAFKFTCFDPNLFSGISTGSATHVESVYEKEGDYSSKDFIIDSQCVLTSIESVPEIPFCPYETIQMDTMVSVHGIVTKVRPAKKFTRRDGSESYVRNITISEPDFENNNKTTLPVVLWDDAGRNTWLVGEHVEIFFALAKIGREGEIEISLGKGGLIRPKFEKCNEFIDIIGTVLHTEDGIVLDSGIGSYLLSFPHPHGTILATRACIGGARLFSESEKLITYSLDEVKNRVTHFLQETE
jgi:replication factor A1